MICETGIAVSDRDCFASLVKTDVRRISEDVFVANMMRRMIILR